MWKNRYEKYLENQKRYEILRIAGAGGVGRRVRFSHTFSHTQPLCCGIGKTRGSFHSTLEWQKNEQLEFRGNLGGVQKMTSVQESRSVTPVSLHSGLHLDCIWIATVSLHSGLHLDWHCAWIDMDWQFSGFSVRKPRNQDSRLFFVFRILLWRSFYVLFRKYAQYATRNT